MLTVVGELDAFTAPSWLDAAAALDQHGDVTVDLRGLVFIGAAGLNAVVEIRNTQQIRHRKLWLLGVSPQTKRVFRAGGLAGLIAVSVRAGEYAVDGHRISAAEVARKLATESERRDQTAPAVWAVAVAAADAEECRVFLDMLGLNAVAVAHAAAGRSSPSDRLTKTRVVAVSPRAPGNPERC